MTSCLGRIQWLILVLVCGVAIMACSGNQPGRASASEGVGRTSAGGDDRTLPTSAGGGERTLPTSASGDARTLPTSVGGEELNIPTTTSTTTTTTTTLPTTTPTIPPPVIPSDVLFDTGRATLKPVATPYLQDLANQIRERHPGARLHFVGHTDSRGSVRANNDLSRRRAEAVLNWFAAHGFERGLLSAEGAGESHLLMPDSDASGRFNEAAGRENRRVEIQILT